MAAPLAGRLRGLVLFAAAVAAVFATHAPILDAPPYWDEVGQFIPAAQDIFHHNRWVPSSTLPNVHPPGVMAYVAVAWWLAGESIRATRSAMLLWAAAGICFTVLLAERLAPERKRSAGILAGLLLLACPLFWAQAPMVLLDLPAMTLTAAVLWLFLSGRVALSAAAATALVLVKETGIAIAFVLALVLIQQKQLRASLLFLIPAAALAGWVAVLWSATGNILGNQEFAAYNLAYPLHPVRLAGALLRRAYYLGIANFHWVALLLIAAAWRRKLFRTREWAIAGAVFGLHILTVSALGGAVLERYVLPALPIFYAAAASAAAALPLRATLWRAVPLLAGMAACIFVNPPYPFPFENNLAWVDFVSLQREAAAYLEREMPSVAVSTAWPLTDALQKPELGFVSHRRPVHAVADFRRSAVLGQQPPPEVVVLYCRTWDPEWGVLRWGWVRRVLSSYWGYEQDVTGADVAGHLGLRRSARWERRGQWIEIWSKAPVTALRISR